MATVTSQLTGIGVGICFEYTPEVKFRDLWLLNIRAFNVQAWERNMAEDEIMSDNIVSIKTVDDLPKDMSLVVVSPQNGEYVQGEVALPDFKHPKKAIYYFGPDNRHLAKEDLGNKTYESVYIPMSATGENLWSPQAASIVLYDRLLKEQYGNNR